MPDIWRPKRYSELSEQQLAEKLQRGSDYEAAVSNLYATLPHNEAQVEKAKLWDTYVEWAKVSGIYEQITPAQQLTEVEGRLTIQVEQVNLIRTELNKPLVEVKEKAVKAI